MKRTHEGFSLIEVLIAFVVLVLGVLGASTLVIRSSQANMKLYEMERITIGADMIIEAMVANPLFSNMYTTETAAKHDCGYNGGTCTVKDMVENDLYTFNQELTATGLPNIDYTLTPLSNDDFMGVTNTRRYELKVVWGEKSGNNQSVYYTRFAIPYGTHKL